MIGSAFALIRCVTYKCLFSHYLDDIWVSHLHENQTTLTIFHIMSATHGAKTCLIFVGNLCKLGGNMWLWGDDQFVLWVLYNEKLVRQYFILHVATLESWHNQYSHQSWLSLANRPCRTCWAHCPLTQDWTMEGFPPFNTKLGGKKSLIPKPRSTPSSTPIVNRVIRKVSWREGFGLVFEKIVWHALKVEQVFVAIKKHRHKSFEGPEMVKKKICSCVASAPRESIVALSEGPLLTRVMGLGF